MPDFAYQFPIDDFPWNGPLGHRFFVVHERIVRLDERARNSPLQGPWSERLLYGNATAAMYGQGCLVDLEDLVLLDGFSFSGVMTNDLSSAWHLLRVWKKALKADAVELLKASMPGEAASVQPSASRGPVDGPEYFYDPDWDEAGRLEAWRKSFRSGADLPPLLAAATAWDAWHTLQPEQSGTWRSTLLASLVLKVRGTTRQLLLPLDTGHRAAKHPWRASDDVWVRLERFLDLAEAAVERARKELDKLVLAEKLLRSNLKGLRKCSALPRLVDLLLARPLVSMPMAVKELGLSRQAVRAMWPKLGSTAREVSGRQRYRVWSIG